MKKQTNKQEYDRIKRGVRLSCAYKNCNNTVSSDEVK